MLVHTVYFWLKPELDAEACAAFRKGVETLGTIGAAEVVYVGGPADTPVRPVVDNSFSVALTVVCKDIPAHDEYQADPIHRKFVADFSTYWDRLIVYDAQ